MPPSGPPTERTAEPRSSRRDELATELERTRRDLAAAERELRDLDRDRGVAERAADRARAALESARKRAAALE